MSAERQESDNTTAETHKRSLVPILIGVLALAAVAVAVSFFLKGRRDAAEQQAAAQLKELGALVVNTDGHTSSLAINLPGIKDKLDEALPLAAKLGHLKSLNASTSSISDSQLAYVGQITSLIDLNLQETPITDTGLEHLSGLANVETLYLDGTGITSAGLPALAKLSSLKVLGLGNTKVSGNYEALTQLDQLLRLIVMGLELSDEDVDAIARIPNLNAIDLGGAKVSETGMKKLAAAEIRVF